MSASSTGSIMAVISVMRPSATVKTSRDSGVPSSFQATTPSRPLTVAARPCAAPPATRAQPATLVAPIVTNRPAGCGR